MKKKALTIIGVLVLLIAAYFLYTYFHSPEKLPENAYGDDQITVDTFKEDAGWGYEIFIDGSLYVHQPNIPSVGGNQGFKTEADARTTGNLAVEKIKKGIIPPTLSTEELKAAGVI